MINKYSLYYAKVKYEDDSNQFKVRPVIVIENKGHSVLCYKVTGTEPRENQKGEYTIKDWRQAGLRKPSTIRATKSISYQPNILVKYIGKLTYKDIKLFEEQLHKDFNEDLNNVTCKYSVENYEKLGIKLDDIEKHIFTKYGKVFEKLEEYDMEAIRYSYKGPVFRFGQVWDFIEEPIYTEARTKRQAVNNLTFKAKMMMGLERDSNLTLHTPYVKEEPFTTKEYHNIMKQISKETPKQKCQHCGTELNSLGDCPVCDYGEEDMLED